MPETATLAQTVLLPTPPVTPPFPPLHSAPTTPMPSPSPSTILRFTVKKNARQGEPFDAEIMIEPHSAKPQLVDIRFENDMGLTVSPPHWRIQGTPTRSGEFTLDVVYSNTEGGQTYVGKLPLVINPDPKTLWKDEPSGDANSTLFWKEDNVHQCVQSQDAKIVAARRRGRSHAHKGTCCDDDFFIEVDPVHGWHLAIVADGAGSAKFSRHGSKVATDAAAAFLKQALAATAGEELRKASADYANSPPLDPQSAKGQTLRNCLYVTLGHAAHAAVKALHKAVDEHPEISHVKELSTTLLIGLARKIGTRWFCAAYWVGDGAVGVYRENRDIVLLGDADSGEFSGQTRFLAAEEVQQESLLRRLRFVVVEDMTAFVLMTDGVSDPKFPSEMKLGELAEWNALWQDIDRAARLHEEGDADSRLLDWLNFWATGEYDDRTIAIIY
ncbi:MAG: protein phosphatase 2C domain-containing protein [Zoogloeaceae bacterium]|nr:protein phosphatase 2C domain-containing protein [Zoogloeaceae bacterium]